MIRISLKGYKSIQGNEGMAFRTTVLVDGKPIGTVSDDGNGAEHRYDFFHTPNGKPVAGGFTPTMRKLRDANTALFRTAMKEAGELLGMPVNFAPNETGKVYGDMWDGLFGEIVAQYDVLKRAVKNAANKYPITLLATPPFDPENSTHGLPSHGFGGRQMVSGISTIAHLDECVAESPRSRIYAVNGECKEIMGLLYVGPTEWAWARENKYALPDTALVVDRVKETLQPPVLVSRTMPQGQQQQPNNKTKQPAP
jgi:hypothetical protein